MFLAIKNKIDLKHKFYILIHQNYHLLLEEIKEVINMGYIYKITNLVNKKPYVGKTVNTVAVRWAKHKDEAFNQNSPWLIHRAMRKYGIENFVIEELEKCSDEILSEREQYWIRVINSYFKDGYGYNMTIGGDGIQQYSDAQILELWNQGFNCDKIAKILSCCTHTVYHRIAAIIGPNAATQRRAETNRKPILQYDLNGNFLRSWSSMLEAQKQLGLSAGSLTACCQKKYTQAGGSLWKTADDDTPIEQLMINYAKSKNCNAVDKIDKDGNILATYPSATAGARANNVHASAITNICNHKYGHKTTHGQYWQWSYPLKRQLIEDGNDS